MVARAAQRVLLGAEKPRKIAGVRLVTKQALTRRVGSMHDLLLLRRVALSAQLAALRLESDSGLPGNFVGSNLVTVFAENVKGGVNDLALLFVGVTLQASVAADLKPLEVRMFGYSLRVGGSTDEEKCGQ